MDEITAEFIVGNGSSVTTEYNMINGNYFNSQFNINMYPQNMSELNDDIGLAQNINLIALQTQVNNFQTSEDTEMTNIVEIIQRCADNLIDLTEIEI